MSRCERVIRILGVLLIVVTLADSDLTPFVCPKVVLGGEIVITCASNQTNPILGFTHNGETVRNETGRYSIVSNQGNLTLSLIALPQDNGTQINCFEASGSYSESCILDVDPIPPVSNLSVKVDFFYIRVSWQQEESQLPKNYYFLVIIDNGRQTITKNTTDMFLNRTNTPPCTDYNISVIVVHNGSNEYTSKPTYVNSKVENRSSQYIHLGDRINYTYTAENSCYSLQIQIELKSDYCPGTLSAKSSYNSSDITCSFDMKRIALKLFDAELKFCIDESLEIEKFFILNESTRRKLIEIVVYNYGADISNNPILLDGGYVDIPYCLMLDNNATIINGTGCYKEGTLFKWDSVISILNTNKTALLVVVNITDAQPSKTISTSPTIGMENLTSNPSPSVSSSPTNDIKELTNIKLVVLIIFCVIGLGVVVGFGVGLFCIKKKKESTIIHFVADDKPEADTNAIQEAGTSQDGHMLEAEEQGTI